MVCSAAIRKVLRSHCPHSLVSWARRCSWILMMEILALYLLLLAHLIGTIKMGSTGGGVVCFVVLFARTLWKTYVEQKQRAYRNYAASCDASLSLNAIASAEMSCLILPRFCTW